jgi:hypothetical protein
LQAEIKISANWFCNDSGKIAHLALNNNRSLVLWHQLKEYGLTDLSR